MTSDIANYPVGTLLPNHEFAALTGRTYYTLGATLYETTALDNNVGVLVGQHGPWIEHLHNLRDTAWGNNNSFIIRNACVDRQARIYSSTVEDDAHVTDDARIHDSFVYDNAKVVGNAQLHDGARIGGSALVRDNAIVTHGVASYFDVTIGGDIYLMGPLTLPHNVELTDNSHVLRVLLSSDANGVISTANTVSLYRPKPGTCAPVVVGSGTYEVNDLRTPDLCPGMTASIAGGSDKHERNFEFNLLADLLYNRIVVWKLADPDICASRFEGDQLAARRAERQERA